MIDSIDMLEKLSNALIRESSTLNQDEVRRQLKIAHRLQLHAHLRQLSLCSKPYNIYNPLYFASPEFFFGESRIDDGDEAASYELVGLKMIQNARYTTLWMNDGYHDPSRGEFTNYPDAAEELARKFAEFAELSEDDQLILDVGFGYGDQCFLWVRDFLVQRVVGINIAATNVQVATKRVRMEGLQDKIELFQGDAVKMDIIKDVEN